MPVIISNKSLKFEQVVMHHLSFKNVNANNFDELYDALNEYLFKHQAIVISSTLTGNRVAAKTIKKAAKKVFDEVNWSLNWIGSTKETDLSGDFVAVSGVNVKAFVSENFITKVFDTPNARYVYVGEVLATSNEGNQQLNEVHNIVNAALGLVGLSAENIIRSWYYCESPKNCNVDLNNITEPQALTKTVIGSGNQHQTKMMASFYAIQPKTNNVVIEPVKGLFENGKAVIVKSQHSIMLLISTGLNANAILNEKSIENNIEIVLNSIETLINEFELKWSQLWRGIAYFSDIKDMAIFKKICKEKQIPMASLLMVQAEFYDDKNAFDMEVDFVKTNEE